MSYFIEAFQKMTRKTPTPPGIMFNSKDSSYVVVDAKTGMPRLQNQSIQPQVGMYSVLTMGNNLDIVVRYERTLPYTLPVGSDEDCPQVMYVMPRQDMKAGDFFTLFVGREHFMVEVVQLLLKSPSDYGSEKDSGTSSLIDAPIAPREQPVQSRENGHSEPRSSNTDRRQDEDILTPPSPQPISKPVTKPLPSRPDRCDRAVFCTTTPVDVGKIQNSTRANVPATSGNHSDRARYAFMDPDPAPICIRPSDKIHQIHPSIHHDISHLDPSRRQESPKRMHDKISDASKTTREKEKVRRRSAAERGGVVPSGITASKRSHEPQAVLIEPILHKYISSTAKKTHGTNKEPPRSSLPLRELRNIGRRCETWTIEDSTNSSATSSVDSYLLDAIKHRPTVPLEPSPRCPLAPQESDIQGLDGDHVIYVASKCMRISQYDFERLRLHGRALHA